MNDYDDVRTCCEGKKVCTKCWKLLIIAVEIIEKALSEDFGFEQLMFVFSGGRGLHIWVNDKRARELKDSVRKGLVDYLELVTGNVKADSLLAEKVVGLVDNNFAWRTKGKEMSGR
jgi:DNA primase small subunit